MLGKKSPAQGKTSNLALEDQQSDINDLYIVDLYFGLLKGYLCLSFVKWNEERNVLLFYRIRRILTQFDRLEHIDWCAVLPQGQHWISYFQTQKFLRFLEIWFVKLQTSWEFPLSQFFGILRTRETGIPNPIVSSISWTMAQYVYQHFKCPSSLSWNFLSFWLLESNAFAFWHLCGTFLQKYGKMSFSQYI